MADVEACYLSNLFESKGKFNQEGGERPILEFYNLDENEAKGLEKFGANRYPSQAPNKWVIQNRRNDKNRVRSFIEKITPYLGAKTEAAKVALQTLDIWEHKSIPRGERKHMASDLIEKMMALQPESSVR